MNNPTNYNNASFENGTPGPLPAQNMSMNPMPYSPQFMNCYNTPNPQNMPGYNNMANYNQFNNCYPNYPNQTYVNYNHNNGMNPNMNKDFYSNSMLNLNAPKME